MATDPAVQRAQARRDMGLTRDLQVPVENAAPHPKRGGNAYPVWYRHDELQRHANGEPTQASASSIYRWKNRLEPYRSTGNKEKERLVGRDQYLMCFFLTIWPDATADEIAVFIVNHGGDVYERHEISKKLKELELTRKVGSTEAYQAFTLRNMLRAQLFFSRPLPLGVRGLARYKLIDGDEFGMAMQRVNRKRGHCYYQFRIRKPGHYCRDTKLTVMYFIEPGDPRLPPHVYGSIQWPRRWIKVTQNAGTTAVAFADMVNEVCTDIEMNMIAGTDEHRVFMWDNLRAHLAPIVAQTVEARNGPCHFSSVPRPPYQAKYGPIEYKICDIVQELERRAGPDWDTARLEQEIYNVAGMVGMDGSFNNTFDHCGY